MTRRDRLVEAACRRAELARAVKARESRALQHPERPSRERLTTIVVLRRRAR